MLHLQMHELSILLHLIQQFRRLHDDLAIKLYQKLYRQLCQGQFLACFYPIKLNTKYEFTTTLKIIWKLTKTACSITADCFDIEIWFEKYFCDYGLYLAENIIWFGFDNLFSQFMGFIRILGKIIFPLFSATFTVFLRYKKAFWGQHNSQWDP